MISGALAEQEAVSRNGAAPGIINGGRDDAEDSFRKGAGREWPVGLIALDRDMVIVEANRRASALLGGDIVGTRLSDHLDRHHSPHVATMLQSVPIGERQVFSVMSSSGACFRVECTRDESGGYAIAVCEGASDGSSCLFSRIVEQAERGFVLIEGGRVVYANHAAARKFGYAPRSLLIGTPLSDLISKSDMDGLRNAMENILNGVADDPVRSLTGIRPDGSAFPFCFTLSKGVVEGKAAIAAVMKPDPLGVPSPSVSLEHGSRFRKLFESMQDAAAVFRYVIGPEGNVADWVVEDVNHTMLRSKGLATLARWGLGARVLDLLNQERLDDVMQGMDVMHMTTMLRARGMPFTVKMPAKILGSEFVVTFIPLDQERFMLTFTDTTEVAEARRSSAQHVARLKAIISMIPVGINMTDASGSDLVANDVSLDLWGVRKPADELPLAQEDGRIIMGRDFALSQALAGRSVSNKIICLATGDDRPRVLMTSGCPIEGEDGEMLGAVSMSMDVTAGKEVEAAKSRAGMYVDLLMHDLTNYNATIRGYLQMAASQPGLEDQERRCIAQAMRALVGSSDLLSNVRDLYHAEQGECPKDVIDISMLLSEIQQAFDAPSGKEVCITLGPSQPLPVLASSLLRRAFHNIVSNSVRHSSGPVRIWIDASVMTVDDADWAVVRLSDDGPGIPDECKASVFHRYHAGSDTASGHGLGLHLVRYLVEDHGGRVWAEDRVPGDRTQGTSVVVALPLAR